MLPAILGLGQICSWGTLYYSFPLIVTRMELELGWSKSDLYAGATIGLLMTALCSYPVGMGIDRGWGKWIMTGASVAAIPRLVHDLQLLRFSVGRLVPLLQLIE